MKPATWIVMFLIEGQLGDGRLSSSSSWWDREQCCSSGVALAHGWLFPQEIRLKYFQNAAKSVSESLTLCPGTKRWPIASYSHVLNRNSSFDSNPGGRSRLSRSLTHSLTGHCVLHLRIMCLHSSTDQCDVAHIAHLSRISVFIACSSLLQIQHDAQD